MTVESEISEARERLKDYKLNASILARKIAELERLLAALESSKALEPKPEKTK